MQHSTSVWINIRKAKHTTNSTPLVVSKAPCALDLKPEGAPKFPNCTKIRALYKGNKVFLTQKFDLSRLCTTQSRVHETRADWFFLHYGVALCSPYINCRKRRKNMIFSVYFPNLCWELDEKRTNRIFAHSGPVPLVCHGIVLSCAWCVPLGADGLRESKSWLWSNCKESLALSSNIDVSMIH